VVGGEGGFGCPPVLTAAFVSLHQSQQLILLNVEAIQAVVSSVAPGTGGAEIRFSDGTAINVDESVQDIEALL
jgi:hypothetical protein